MKNFNFNSVKSSLSRDEMRSISGGRRASFSCYCGFTGGSGEGSPFSVTADGIGDALWGAGAVCGGQGATCSGN